MEIAFNTHTTNLPTFDSILQGECFLYDGFLMMKTEGICADGMEWNAVHLGDGGMEEFAGNEPVQRIDCKVVKA